MPRGQLAPLGEASEVNRWIEEETVNVNRHPWLFFCILDSWGGVLRWILSILLGGTMLLSYSSVYHRIYTVWMRERGLEFGVNEETRWGGCYILLFTIQPLWSLPDAVFISLLAINGTILCQFSEWSVPLPLLYFLPGFVLLGPCVCQYGHIDPERSWRGIAERPPATQEKLDKHEKGAPQAPFSFYVFASLFMQNTRKARITGEML